MFTGLVEEVGRVRHVSRSGSSLSLTVEAPQIARDLKTGDSVAVNGVCLTVDRRGSLWFTSHVMPETARKTNLGGLAAESPVNLERALAAGGRLGGHLVLGHVDGVGSITSVRPEGGSVIVGARAPRQMVVYLTPRGSIAVDGVSLTLARVQGEDLSVALVRHTLASTTLGNKRPGDKVNLEADIIGKYVLSMTEGYLRLERGRRITATFLREHGWLDGEG